MNAFLGRIVLIGVALTAVACSEPTKVNVKPVQDESAFKQNFSDAFNHSCYNGFTLNFENRVPPATKQDYRAAKEICECIVFNLVENNNATQLNALSNQTPEQVLAATRPLVQSCSSQIKQKFNQEHSTAPQRASMPKS